jgi:hypothetical protein
MRAPAREMVLPFVDAVGIVVIVEPSGSLIANQVILVGYRRGLGVLLGVCDGLSLSVERSDGFAIW